MRHNKVSIMAMRIKCSHSGFTGAPEAEVFEFPSKTIDILADDGRTLFCIKQKDDGSIDVSSGSFCKHNEVMLDGQLIIQPVATNVVNVSRNEYGK